MEAYMTFLAIASLVWLFSLFFLRKLSSPKTKLNLPPSPPALPIIGHLHLLGPSPHLSLHNISRRLGPVIHLRLGSVPCVVASNADTAREFLRTNELFFAERARTIAIDCLNHSPGGVTFAPYGDYWRFTRKLCMSELLGSRTLQRLQWIRREEIGKLFQTLHDKAQKRQAIDVGVELTKVTSNVICRMAMSKRCFGTDGEASDVKELMDESSVIMGKFNIGDFVGFLKNFDVQGMRKRAENLQRRFDEMMWGVLKEREEVRRENKKSCEGEDGNNYGKDLLDILLDISEDEGAEMKLTRENIIFFVRDMFAAASGSTATTTEWALAELINHPAILAKARQEIDSVVGKSRMVNESDIPNLPYLYAIVKETLRIHPAGPLIPRAPSSQHCMVKGYDIPANTRLFINIWSIGRDPNLWEDPLEFRPDRFMEGGKSNGVELRGQHYQLLPFGSGRRGCPGISLALDVMLPTLGAMIQCFEWGVEKGVVDMTEGQGLLIPRAQPLVCTPTARLNQLLWS